MGTLLYHIATRFKGSDDRVDLLLQYVCDNRIASEPQLTGRGLYILYIDVHKG